MKYKFASVHRIEGISYPEGQKENIIISEYPQLNARALLVIDLNEYLIDFDRLRAIPMLMLKGLLGQAASLYRQNIIKEIEKLRELRSKEFEHGVFLAFEAGGEIEAWNPTTEKEFEDFVVVFDAVPKEFVSVKYQSKINEILMSFAINCDGVCGIDQIEQAVYFINESGKVTYSYNVEFGNVRLIAYERLIPGSLECIRKQAENISKKKELRDPIRLLVSSLKNKNDDLLAFLSAWAGLEIFVNKVFKSYEHYLFESTKSSNNSKIQLSVTNRIRSTMKGKWNIRDKFIIIASVLSLENLTEDTVKFDQIRTIRDSLFHKQNIALESLPTADTQKLLRKYLSFHSKRKG